jgi:hypothetical protein
MSGSWDDDDRAKLADLTLAQLTIDRDDRICGAARATAIKARVP